VKQQFAWLEALPAWRLDISNGGTELEAVVGSVRKHSYLRAPHNERTIMLVPYCKGAVLRVLILFQCVILIFTFLLLLLLLLFLFLLSFLLLRLFL